MQNKIRLINHIVNDCGSSPTRDQNPSDVLYDLGMGLADSRLTPFWVHEVDVELKSVIYDMMCEYVQVAELYTKHHKAVEVKARHAWVASLIYYFIREEGVSYDVANLTAIFCVYRATGVIIPSTPEYIRTNIMAEFHKEEFFWASDAAQARLGEYLGGNKVQACKALTEIIGKTSLRTRKAIVDRYWEEKGLS